MNVFSGGGWFWFYIECVEFTEKHIPVGQFQWFIDIVSYLVFVTGETVLTTESQQDEFHADMVHKTREKSIAISDFKTDIPPILGGLGEEKESTTPLTAIRTPELCNAHYGVRGVYLWASSYVQDQILKLNAGINRDMVFYMEAQLLASEFLGKCGVF